MSHFSCLVIGADHEKLLAPFHEFECTGRDDEFVQDIDKTEEYRQEWLSQTTECLKSADGVLHKFFDDEGAWRPEFSRPAQSAGPFDSDRREQYVPDGYELVTAPRSQVETFAEFIKGWAGHEVVSFGGAPDLSETHKYGYVIVDGSGEVVRAIDRTNPNAHWDWWCIGGRWSGFFKTKTAGAGSLGERGLMGSHRASGPDRADRLLKTDIDFDGMRDEAGNKAGVLWNKAHSFTSGVPWESWESVRDRMDIQSARAFYNAQPSVVALKGSGCDEFSWEIDDALSGPRDAFVQAVRDRALSPFALIHNGEWHEKGSMGWWGCVSDEKPQAEWNRRVNELIDSLPGDTVLTLVDCHI